LDLLLRQYKTHKANVTTNFYQNIPAMPEAESLRGHLFEWQVLNYLNDIRDECTFPILRLTGSE
jgi:hypothetical protein